jgi:YD repeat-containing protein
MTFNRAITGLTIVVGTILCTVGLAFGQGSTLPASKDVPPWSACEWERLRGRVKSVTIWSGAVDHATGQQQGDRLRRSSIEYSEDGRVASETSSGSVAKYEFDAAGRLVRHAIFLDGAAPVMEEKCSYDALGRLASSRQSRDGREGAIIYSYADHEMTVRIAGSVLTYSFDSDRGLTRTISRGETGQISEERYVYSGDGRERCSTSARASESCTLFRFDDHGHVVESRTRDGRGNTDKFDYDDIGNWVMHASNSGSRRDEVVWRDITYK